MPFGAEEALLAFYAQDGRDVQGRTHSEILAWSDAMLEAVHDYIQWLFPLPEPSSANCLAPLVTPRVCAAFLESQAMRKRLRDAFLRMLHFYGLTLNAEGAVKPAASYALRSRNWLTPYNHNHLRLTRLLRSLHLLGLEQESAALFAALETIYRKQSRSLQCISPETFHYWQRARG